MEKKILIADDHSLIRNGLKVILQTKLGILDIGQVSSCNGLMEELKTRKYTHLVLDIHLSDGSILEVLGNVNRLYPGLKMAIVTMQSRGIYERVLKNHGISIYISKEASDEEVTRQLKQFLQNDLPKPEDRVEEKREKPSVDFTPREVEVLGYMLKGLRTNDIADVLGLKGNTVSTVKNRIFEKTKTINLIQLQEFVALYNINKQDFS
jgi:DNA-binding NarL/FixJ family response regulator